MPRILLFLSADSFQAYLWKESDLSVAGSFSNDSDGRTRFAAFLKQNRRPTYLLVDIIEEDFHLETVPHLIGPSRGALLDRKFEQYYRSTPFRQATLVQRLSEGRRDDEFLFSALTNPQRISPWLDTLLAQHIPLAGLYSIPIISAPLLQHIASEHVLLLSWEKSAGLRQTYFNNKRLHFSRLIPVINDSSFAKTVADETPRTQQYLKSLSLPPPGEVLDVHIICHADDRAALQTQLSNDSDLRYTYLTSGVRQEAQMPTPVHRFRRHAAVPAPARHQCAGRALRHFQSHALLHVVATAPLVFRPGCGNHIGRFVVERFLFLAGQRICHRHRAAADANRATAAADTTSAEPLRQHLGARRRHEDSGAPGTQPQRLCAAPQRRCSTSSVSCWKHSRASR